MNTPLINQLDALLAAHVGCDGLKTPLLNRAHLLLAASEVICKALAQLTLNGPVLGDPDVITAKQLRAASGRYWSDLAPGTLVSRLDHAKALRSEELIQRAGLLAVFGEMTEQGIELLTTLIEPGEQAAAVSVCAVALQTTDSSRVTLPGALLLEHATLPVCVLLFPGLEQQLFQFDNRQQAGHALIEYLLGDRSAELWAFLTPHVDEHWVSPPFADLGVSARFATLKQDALTYSLKACIATELAAQLAVGQAAAKAHCVTRAAWSWRALPTSLEHAVLAASAADGERHAKRLTFGSINADLANVLVEKKIKACEVGICQYIGESLDSYEHKRYRQIHAAWQAAGDKTREVIDELHAQGPRVPVDFWHRLDDQGLTPRQRLVVGLGSSLRHEAQLQVYETSLAPSELELIEDVVTYPVAVQRTDKATVVAEIAIGHADFSYRLPGAYVIASPQTWSTTRSASIVLLFLAGEDGGLQRFSTLQALLDCVAASLKDPAFMPLWDRFSSARQMLLLHLLRGDSVPLVTRPVPDNWLDDCVGTAIENYPKLLASAANDDQRNLMFDMFTQHLATPAHEVRETALERVAEQRRLQQVLQGLPSWLATAAEPDKKQYAQLLNDYNLLATAQESYLEDKPTLVEAFAIDVLKKRLKVDLALDIDPQHILIKLPESVEVKVIANVPSHIHVPSKARESLSLVELGLLNIDRQVTLRLKHAQLLAHDTLRPLTLKGVSVDYLRCVVIELDIARRYRQYLTAVFSLSASSESEQKLRTQVLALPHAAALKLAAFSAWQQGGLSKAGWQALCDVLAARTAQSLRAGLLDARIRSVRLSLGGEEQEMTSALLVIEDQATGTCFLYLPNAPEGVAFIEASSVQGLLDQLLRRMSSVAMRQWLASLGGIGQPTSARQSYIEQAWQRGYSGFISLGDVSHAVWPLAAAVLDNRRRQLLDQARQVSRSREDIRRAFADQLRDAGKQLLWSGLYYVPGIGTALQLWDGWNDTNAAVEAFGSGDTAAGLRHMASAEMNFGFALLLFVPGIKASTAARKALLARKTPQTASIRLKRQVARLDGFAGHETAISLAGAKPGMGMDAGVWKLNAKLYLWQDSKVYEVFRRRGELTLRLRRTSANSYEHPVRLRSDGRFVTHVDTGLRGGGRSRTSSLSRADASTVERYLIESEQRALTRQIIQQRGRYTLDEIANTVTSEPGDVARRAFLANRRKLLSDADQYLKDVELAPRVELPVVPSEATHAALIAAIYEKSNGLVIGEAHASAASKRFLIDNFATLKTQGVKTLYFEHLHLDFFADDLAALNRTGVMSADLKRYLKDLDAGHRVDHGQPYTFHNVIAEANKQGLEVVGIDCATAYYVEGMHGTGVARRQRMFSYIATQAIQAHQATGEHKWIALVGNSHSNTQRGTLGLAELNQAIGMRVAEPKVGKRAQMQPDPGLATTGGQVKADFLLEVEVPLAEAGRVSPTPSLTPSAVLEIERAVDEFMGKPPAGLPPAPPRLRHPGAFYVDKSAAGRMVVHLGRDGNIHRTVINKTLGFYSLSRPSWDKVHERRFWTLQGLLDALKEQGLSRVA
jgi:hypothetical protein